MLQNQNVLITNIIFANRNILSRLTLPQLCEEAKGKGQLNCGLAQIVPQYFMPQYLNFN